MFPATRPRHKPALFAPVLDSFSLRTSDGVSLNKRIDFAFRYRFPSRESDRERYESWVRAVNRQTETGKLWTPSPHGHDKICSAHFLETDFKPNTTNRFLKSDVIPSVFPHHPPHMQKSLPSPRPPPRKRKLSPVEETDTFSPSTSGAHCNKIYHPSMDHSYNAFSSPEQHIKVLNERINQLEDELEKCRRENKSLKEKLKRREGKVMTLTEQLTDEKLIDEEKADLLDLNFDKDTMTLIENELKASSKSTFAHRYSDAVKSFAVTVHFYSAQAYSYLRKFLHLPNPSTIRRWASSINCEPGFLSEVLNCIGEEVKENPDMQDVCIMFDSLAIKKEYTYDDKSQSYSGGVNFGSFCNGCSDDLATEALFFMVVGLRGHWKRPFGYFLGKVNGTTQAQIVKHAISLLTEKNFTVHGVICDGNFTNQSTGQALGCSLSMNNLRTYFPHPDDEATNIYFILDACHLVKCVRNCLGDLKVLTYNGQYIKWSFVEALHQVQQSDNLYLANKVSAEHINYSKNKMNVRLAAQTLSRSVADAIDFLREDLRMSEFQGSEATTEFLRNIDKAFDLCNSSSPISKGFKSKINLENLSSKVASFNELSQYIRELKDASGKPLACSRRKTPFLGFLVTMQSLSDLATRLLQQEVRPFQYVLTYKFSQDHLELLFSRLRRKGGWNNNPNTLQLKYALRSLLLKNGVVSSRSANCLELLQEASEPAIFDQVTPPSSSDNKDLLTFQVLVASPSDYHDHALFYISGFICRKMVQKSKCTQCSGALYILASSIPKSYQSAESAFVHRKDRGGLLASNDFYIIIKAADNELKMQLLTAQTPIKAATKHFISTLQTVVCATVRPKVFLDVNEHF